MTNTVKCIFFFQDGKLCLLNCMNPNEQLQTLTKEATWQVILKASQIRECKVILDMSEHGTLPDLRYHRKCYQTFTMKSKLELVTKSRDEKNNNLRRLLEGATSYDTEDSKQKRKGSSTSSCSSSALLPNKCLFCEKVTKYKRFKKPENLRQCHETRVVETIRKSAEEKKDFKINSVLETSDLIAAEAKYHSSCYTGYTRQKPLEGKKRLITEYKTLELEALHLVITYCHEIINEPQVVALTELVSTMNKHFTKHNVELSKSTKKNLRRNLAKTFADEIKFLGVKEKVYVYPIALTLENTLIKLIESRRGNIDDVFYMVKAAECVRKEVKGIKDQMPWPPEPDDLKPEKFRISDRLRLFLTVLFSGSAEENELSTRIARIRLAMAQDIVYILSNETVKTSRSILLPSTIKTLTNNIELINIINRLGHGIIYSILSELQTEYAYKVQDQQIDENVIIPLDSRKEEFTIYVANNIDRREETLSGKIMKFASRTVIWCLCFKKKEINIMHFIMFR